MLPKKTLLAVAAIGIVAMMLLPSSVMAANSSNPYDVFEQSREVQNNGFERSARTIYSNANSIVNYYADILDCVSNFGMYFIVDLDWSGLGEIRPGNFDLWISYNTNGPTYTNVGFNIDVQTDGRLGYYLSWNTNYAEFETNSGSITTTERFERIYIAIESYVQGSYNYLTIKYWTDETGYNDSIGHVKVRRLDIDATGLYGHRYLGVRNSIFGENNQYPNITVTQFDDPENPPQWRKLQTVTAGYDTYDPWMMIQRVITTIEQIIPTWKEIQTVSTDIISQLLKWLPLQNVFTSLQVQFPVWTMIQKIGHHLTVTSLMSQGMNFIILMMFILLPSLIAYAIVGRPGLLIGLMTTTILWTINEPKFLTSAFVIWTTCAVVLWRSIR